MKEILMTSTAAIEQRLSVYHTLTNLFLAVGCVSLAASIALFFSFRIARIMAVKLGIAAKRTIKEIEEANIDTGNKGKSYRDSRDSRRREFLVNEGSGETSLLGAPDNDTVVLNAAASQLVGETTELEEDAGVQIGRFTITREIVMIHTEERI